jgi:hypothetical protein
VCRAEVARKNTNDLKYCQIVVERELQLKHEAFLYYLQRPRLAAVLAFDNVESATEAD